MYDKLLDVFIAVADHGSFTKAAETLFLSPTAVIKQINQLEANCDLSLFLRNNRGITLTEVGKAFYSEAKKIISFSNESLSRIKMLDQTRNRQIRIGSSLLRSNTLFLDIWIKVRNQFPEFSIQIVPFEDTPSTYAHHLRNLNTEIDIIAGSCSSHFLTSACQTLPLIDVPLCIALPYTHRLSARNVLNIEDLFGEQIMIGYQGSSPSVDIVRSELQAYPQIEIIDTPDYSTATFNQCEAENKLMLIAENWGSIHPTLKTIPVNWNFKMPFGLIYAANPSPDVQAFVAAVEQIVGLSSLP